jgi:hypothetical protein
MDTPIPPEYLRQLELLPIRSIDLGAFGILVYDEASLSEAQTGYGGDDWSTSWLVIAYDTGHGDPFFIDGADPRFPVYTAMHGCGAWKPSLVASSFRNFAAGLTLVAPECKGREHPAGLKARPISRIQFAVLSRRLRATVGTRDAEFWIEFVRSSAHL